MKNKLLLFGGVYSNLQALEKLKQVADELGFLPEQVICNGDIVGYCAQPEETVQLIKDWGIQCITGNVELQLREGQEDCGCDFDEGTRCDVFSRQWYPFAQKLISKESVEWLKEMPEHLSFEFAGKNISVVHGAKSHVSKYIFKSTPWQEKQVELDLCQADVIIAGHSGLPFTDVKEGKLWINPGVIGMPANDGTTRVWYGVLSQENGQLKVDHCSFEYDNKTANQLMIENKLPEEYAKTLLTGLWDNCEILPEEETNQQGMGILYSSTLY